MSVWVGEVRRAARGEQLRARRRATASAFALRASRRGERRTALRESRARRSATRHSAHTTHSTIRLTSIQIQPSSLLWIAHSSLLPPLLSYRNTVFIFYASFYTPSFFYTHLCSAGEILCLKFYFWYFNCLVLFQSPPIPHCPRCTLQFYVVKNLKMFNFCSTNNFDKEYN